MKNSRPSRQSCSGGGAAQGPCDQGWSALSHIAENLLVRQRISAQFRQGRVDRKGQVEFGIDQRAVQIEDQRADFGEAGDLVPHRIFRDGPVVLPPCDSRFLCRSSATGWLCNFAATKADSQEWLSY